MEAVKTIEAFGTRYVPLRAALDQIGGSVQWDNGAKQATVTANGKTVVVVMEQSAVHVDGGTMNLSAPPLVKAGSLLVPEDFFTVVLGKDVYLA